MAKKEHVGKRPKEQLYYSQRISRVGTESTAEEEIPEFADTDKSEETTTARLPRTRKTKSIRNSILEHFRKNGGIWIIGLVTILLLLAIPYFGKVERIDAITDGLRKDINKLEILINNINTKLQQLELKLQEQGIKLDYLEKGSKTSPTR